jgi:hypothetical protein
MASLTDINLKLAITKLVSKGQSHSIQPLVRYLRDGGALTDDLRSFLVELLDEHGKSELQLRFGRRDNRRMLSEEEVESHFLAWHRVQDLAGATVTETLCTELVRALLGKSARRDPDAWTLKRLPQKSGLRFLIRKRAVTKFDFRAGSAISKENAYKIAAFENSLTPTTVKKMVLEQELIKREG